METISRANLYEVYFLVEEYQKERVGDTRLNGFGVLVVI